MSDNQFRLRTTSENLALTESGKKEAETQLLQKGRSLQVCSKHNSQLYQMGRELIARYEHKSCKDVLLQNELITGLKKVEMETSMEQWRDNFDREN